MSSFKSILLPALLLLALPAYAEEAKEPNGASAEQGAASAEKLKSELKKELSEQLRRELKAELKKELAEEQKRLKEEAEKEKALKEKAESEKKAAEEKEKKDLLATSFKMFDSTVKVKLGGFIKLDTFYNTSKVVNNDSPLWVESEGGEIKDKDGNLISKNENMGSFGMTARTSRLSLSLEVPDITDALSGGGVLEGDFYGNLPDSGTSTRTPQFVLRLAYLHLNWKYVSLIAGNSWIFASPLNPPTLNFTVFAAMGNLWMRAPLIGVKSAIPVHDLVKIHLAASVNRPMAGDGPRNTIVDNGAAGEFGGLPMFQGRLALGVKMLGEKESALGFSGSYHRENHLANSLNISKAGEGKAITLADGKDKSDYNLHAYFFGPDLILHFDKWVCVSGEFYVGQNMDTFWGGILQGVSKDGLTSLRAMGGWGAVSVFPHKTLKINGMFGMEKMNDDDLDPGARRKNTTWAVNAIWEFIPRFTIGLEYQSITTEFADKSAPDAEGKIAFTPVASGTNDKVHLQFGFTF